MAYEIVLMHTQDCHLCEQAEAMLAWMGVSATRCDIALDPALVEQYGVRIPVLVSGQHELGWPFDPDQIKGWLESQS